MPALDELLGASWSADAFQDWVQGHGDADHEAAPIGRLLKGAPPAGLDLLVRRLVAALCPLADTYPLPHFRRPK